jgi:hypothetical protein
MRLALNNVSVYARCARVPFALLAIWTIAGACPALAQQSAQKTFASAANATQSLFQAVQRNNEQAIENILGGPTDLASSRDEAQDKLDRELFVEKYQEMHRLARQTDGSITLYIGAENWPFPVPLVEKSGTWRFDSDTGLKEILFRRVGENEFTAIEICHNFVGDEKQRTAPSTNADPAVGFAESLSRSASQNPVLFQGYYFRVLGTGALLAYPAEYRSSGVMSFIVTGNDVVYEKDLGANTSKLASANASFHKDATWHNAGE